MSAGHHTPRARRFALAGRPARRSPRLPGQVGRLVFDIGAPIALYYVLHGAGVSSLVSLAVGAVLPTLGALWQLAVRHRVDMVAVVVLATISGSLVLSFLAHSPRFLLAEDGLITGIWGAWFLATLAARRPAAFLFARPLLEGRRVFAVTSWDALWAAEPRFRRIWRVATVWWGAGLLADEVIRVVMAYTLPVDVVPGLGGALYPVTTSFEGACSVFRAELVRRVRRVTFAETCRMLTAWKADPQTAWLYEVSNVALQQSLQHLQQAYVNFWGKRAKYPHFKSKRKSRAAATFTTSGFRYRDGRIWLAKMDAPLDIRWSRPLPGGAQPSAVTVSRDAAGRWHISLLVEEAIASLPPASGAVGIDAGITSLVTLSTGEKITNPRHERRDRARLALAQRRLSRKAKGPAGRRPGSKSRKCMPGSRTGGAITCISCPRGLSARTKR